VPKKKIKLTTYASDVTRETLNALDSKCLLVIVGYTTINVEYNKFELEESQKPKYIILTNPDLMDKLLGMVDDNTELSESVWNYLATLPKNEILAKKQKTFDFSRENFMETWCSFLDLKEIADSSYVAYSLYNLLKLFNEYKLKAIGYLSTQRENGCLKFLCNVLRENMNCKYTPVVIKSIQYSLNLINLLWDTQNIKELTKDPMADFKDSANIIKKALIDVKRITTNDTLEILDACFEFHKNLLRLNRELIGTAIVSHDYLQLYRSGKYLVNV
jgi:hypothetical protein